MGNADEATIPDDIPFTVTDLIIVDGPEDVDKDDKKEYNTGGVVYGDDPTTGITYQAPQFQAGQTQVGMAASPIEMAPISRQYSRKLLSISRLRRFLHRESFCSRPKDRHRRQLQL